MPFEHQEHLNLASNKYTQNRAIKLPFFGEAIFRIGLYGVVRVGGGWALPPTPHHGTV